MVLKQLIKNLDYILKIIIKDISSLGSLVFFGFVICFQFALKNYFLSFKLLISLIIAYLIVIIIRLTYYKQRPNKQKYTNLLEKLDSSSFPSMHAIRIMLIGLFFIEFYKNYLIILLFLIIILMVGYSRYHLKKHYIIDILAGYITGICIFLIINLVNF